LTGVRSVLASLAFTGALWSGLGGGGRVWAGDESTLTVLEPALLEISQRPHHGPPRTLRFRFYADAAYRSNVVRWQERVKGWLDDLNRVVTPGFGVRLEAESFHRWERAAGRASVEQALDDLRTQDVGDEADWVVGLIGPLPLVSTSIHQLGMAEELGRHMVIRGMADLEEARGLERALPATGQGEREKLYSRRKWHKEMSVFLHEWGHTLGAPHSREDTEFMCGGYSNHMTRFSAATQGLLEVALACRTGQPPLAASDCKPLLDYLEHTTAPDWYAEERSREIAFLRDRSRPTQTGSRPAAEGGPVLNARQSQAWNETVRLLHVAADQVQAGDRDQALASTTAAAEQARSLPDGGAPLWLAVAQTYQQLGAVTRAIEAVARAGQLPDAEDTRSRLQRARRLYGLGPAIPAESEPGYTRTFDELARALGEGKNIKAALQAALTSYPGAPALTALRCEAELRARRRREAEKLCSAALDAAPEMARAHYLLAMMNLDDGKREGGETHLRRAIDLDPADPNAWHALGDVYRMSGRRKELTDLAEAYQKRFGHRLP
jgi:tetratricopeptide (TPR) repeat protein